MKIFIIGAGPGGYETAVEAAARGIEVVIAEQGQVGGTCLNQGCIPTKTFCRSASLLEEVRSSADFGITLPGPASGTTAPTDSASAASGPAIDFGRVVQRKSEVVSHLRSGVETLLKHKLITLVRGRAEIVDAHTVRVDGTDYVADYIIIATGSSPATLPIPGADLPGVLDSTGLLDIDHVPERLCIVGAGVIGLEFASIFASFGSKVTVLEYAPQILPRFDSDLAKRLKQSLGKRGIEIILKAAVSGIQPSANGNLEVSYSLKDGEHSLGADTVLMAVGRRPNVSGLGLDRAGISHFPKGIEVDGRMRTSVPSIYAIGDVNGLCMLAHAASSQGLVALDDICGLDSKVRLDVIPSAVFTMPEAAAVGLTEEECAARGIAFKTHKSFFRANGKAVSMGQTDGFVKLITSVEGKILGCHLFGPHAADLIHEMAAFICCGASLSDLMATVHAHPTLSEVFRFQ